MDKGIGFNRNLNLSWLDAIAAFCSEIDDPNEIRTRLEPVVGLDLKGTEGIRKTLDVLLGIWVKSAQVMPELRADAIKYFQSAAVPTDRLWLHYGMTMAYYPFFRECVAITGQLGRLGGLVTTRLLAERMTANRGQLGSLKRSVDHIVSTLRRWGILVDSDQRFAYIVKRQSLTASNRDIELWLLACALRSHPAMELPFADLVRLPELFPFRFTVGVEDLRRSPRFEVQRQGAGWDVVSLRVKGSADDVRE